MTAVADLRKRFGTSGTGRLSLEEYSDWARRTDRSSLGGERKRDFLLLGLFGEVGSLLSELKKKQRDRNAYLAYTRSAIEETGDVLWYFANLASHLGCDLNDIAYQAVDSEAASVTHPGRVVRFAELQSQGALFEEPASGEHVERSLLRLAARTGRLVQRATAPASEADTITARDLAMIFRSLVAAADDASVSLEHAALLNLENTLGRWPVVREWGPLYDEACDEDEQLPRHLEIRFREKTVRGTTFVVQSLQGVRIGDRLTDNREDADDYRFHDVFHLSYAAILGWSPVLRALLKVKRKSHPVLDEQQDGARAVITEEGISNWVFAQGARHDDFRDVTSLDFALLKTIREMVKGYEVESRPLWMWEEAILRGFAVFRELRHHRGGVVVADLNARTLRFLGP